MKVYVTGGSEEEIGQMQTICRANAWEFRPMGRIGRPPAVHDVRKVLDAYSGAGSIRSAARMLGLAPGTIWGILKREGVLKGTGVERWRDKLGEPGLEDSNKANTKR